MSHRGSLPASVSLRLSKAWRKRHEMCKSENWRLSSTTSVNIQISFHSFGPFRPFFAGMPAHKLVQAINYLKERKPEAQKNQTDIKDIYKWLI
jgi:hypothetical protein